MSHVIRELCELAIKGRRRKKQRDSAKKAEKAQKAEKRKRLLQNLLGEPEV
jgi:hypothetical protein